VNIAERSWNAEVATIENDEEVDASCSSFRLDDDIPNWFAQKFVRIYCYRLCLSKEVVLPASAPYFASQQSQSDLKETPSLPLIVNLTVRSVEL